ncbi:MAG: hypothetical protein VXW73_01975 [Actinomycetota bacterium]|nr:hypothetical protein [Actinomycetota bacterium]
MFLVNSAGYAPSFERCAVGVGHIVIASISVVPELWPPLFRLAVAFLVPLLSATVAVGQRKDEDAVSAVRCAAFRRAEHSPRRCVTSRFQSLHDMSEYAGFWGSAKPGSNDSLNVLEENAPRSALIDDSFDLRKEVARVFV